MVCNLWHFPEGLVKLCHQKFQVPKMEVLIYVSYKAYVRETPPPKQPFNVQSLHFWDLNLLVIMGSLPFAIRQSGDVCLPVETWSSIKSINLNLANSIRVFQSHHIFLRCRWNNELGNLRKMASCQHGSPPPEKKRASKKTENVAKLLDLSKFFLHFLQALLLSLGSLLCFLLVPSHQRIDLKHRFAIFSL